MSLPLQLPANESALEMMAAASNSAVVSPRAESITACKPQRFTMDGSPVLEQRLEQICARVTVEAQRLFGRAMEALVLGGGYGRGEGGVLKTDTGEEPYNDMEFYAFVRWPRLWAQRRFGPALNRLSKHLSAEAGVHVEFKIDTLARWRRSPVGMFSYDLVSAHRLVFGNPNLFFRCKHHLESAGIPIAEASRLLFNRCGGLLLVKRLLKRSSLSSGEQDFIGRNLAKLQLALGDVVLAIHGKYHFSVQQRNHCLAKLQLDDPPPFLQEVLAAHTAGLEFKLHPVRTTKSLEQLRTHFASLSALALKVWMWLESRRLGCSFSTPENYAFSACRQNANASTVFNYAINIRTFGISAVMNPNSCCYPRERLAHALALLLWGAEHLPSQQQNRIQQLLGCSAANWTELVERYARLWPAYA
jgi:hypothetical protein